METEIRERGSELDELVQSCGGENQVFGFGQSAEHHLHLQNLRTSISVTSLNINNLNASRQHHIVNHVKVTEFKYMLTHLTKRPTQALVTEESVISNECKR